MTKNLLIALGLLSLLAVGLGLYGRRQHLRADQAVQALVMAEQDGQRLRTELKAQAAAVAALRKAGEAQVQRVRQAGDDAGRARRAGEIQVQRILMAVAPEDPDGLAAWGAAQAQDLNRRLEAVP